MSNPTNLPDVFTPPLRGSVEPTARWVRVKHGEEIIADSISPLLLIQFGPSVMPTYFFTHDEIAMDHLVMPSNREGKRFWFVHVDDELVEDGAWTYIDSSEHLASLRDRITFDWQKLQWYEEEEQVFVHARDPWHRVDVLRSSRHVQIVVNGEVIADTHTPYLLFETTLPTRYYIPQEDVQMEYLQEMPLSSQCPYKGVAHYWSVQVGDEMLENVVWSYPDPILENPKIKGLLCFFNEKVDIYVDGELEPRPVTPWS